MCFLPQLAPQRTGDLGEQVSALSQEVINNIPPDVGLYGAAWLQELIRPSLLSSPKVMPQEDSVGTEGQQVLPGAATEAAVAGRVGGSCPAVKAMLRGLEQGLWGEYYHRVPVSHQPMEEMSSFQPLQQLTWGQ